MHEDPSKIKLNLETNVDLYVKSHDFQADLNRCINNSNMKAAAKLTLARLIVGDHHNVKRRFGI